MNMRHLFGCKGKLALLLGMLIPQIWGNPITSKVLEVKGIPWALNNIKFHHCLINILIIFM